MVEGNASVQSYGCAAHFGNVGQSLAEDYPPDVGAYFDAWLSCRDNQAVAHL
jgi:hypothetical protein